VRRKAMLKRINKKYGRAYLDESTGDEYPSVTTILGILSKNLDYWKMMMCGDYIKEEVCKALAGERILDWDNILRESKKASDNYRDKKGAQGTRIHKHIERWFNKESVAAEAKADPRLTAIMILLDRWVKTNQLKPLLVEAYLISKKHKYAGGVDLVARQNTPEHGEQLVLVDFKTGKSIQDTARWQLAAYANAYEEMYGEPIDIAFLQHISYDEQIVTEASHLHKVDIPREFQHFMNIYGAFKARWEKELKLS
jgi:CRISPR/Cas system-associated exonuclease Cas4 (RecB family)